GSGLKIIFEKALGLQDLDGTWRTGQRYADISGDIQSEAPQHAMGQRVESQVEQHARPQEGYPQGAVADEARTEPPGIREGWQQEAIGPYREAYRDSREFAARRAPRPHQSAEEGRRQLGHCCKGNEAYL